ncbi:HAD family hydrolase [Paracoccus seriniphilus]|uniref:HAD family hydrolase n=1 Tax=Paracoccus seriniphilus TaxID=184748 RepID=UPI003561FC9E
MRPELVIFDCDGVIADSEVLSALVLIEQLAEIGIPVTFADVRRDFLGRSFPTVAQTIRDGFGTPLPDDFEARYRATLLERFEKDLVPTPGLRDLLERIDLPICVATSSSPPRVRRTLEILGLSECFGPHVFTASQVARGKPAPDLFLFAAHQMNSNPARTVVIEDSPPGIDAGLAAGMIVLHYTGGTHLKDVPHQRSDVPAFDNWNEFEHLLGGIQQKAAHS